ncbi:MAG: DNA-directed RNA polymerase sigma-70 factor [Acidimicrobiia bacterium]|nr:MAG: DNA-directed RNA polymerase sigma-70 factor [Acidimicrobiia bacterium]
MATGASVASTGMTTTDDVALGPAELEQRLERLRPELTGFCYRMLGSAFDAEDAVQETLVRAWRAYDRFEGRSSLRSWCYRIASNVCFDALNGKQRRARPVDLSPAGSIDGELTMRPDHTWLEPVPDALVVPADGDPAEVAVARESIRLAFVAALQHLPPRQRAVLILRDVLRWQASEVAELLDTTVVSVNSALQRARATLEAQDLTSGELHDPADEEQRALLGRYVEAFERYDIEALVALLHEDATMSMPPLELWLRGANDIAQWMLTRGIECKGSLLVPTTANGAPAVAQYRPGGPGGAHRPWNLQVLDVSDGRIVAINGFLKTELFDLFGLPAAPRRQG